MEKNDRTYSANPSTVLNRFPPIPEWAIRNELGREYAKKKEDQLDRIEEKLDQLLESEYRLVKGVWR